MTWNATRTDYPRDASVPALFTQQAAATPGHVALELDSTQLTYAQLESRANRLAHHLIGLGVQPGELVGLCATRSIELVVAILGILKAGAAYAPLDPAYPAERLALMIKDTGSRVILASSEAADAVRSSGAQVLLLEELQQLAAAAPDVAPSTALAGPTAAAYVMYTSGSTGLPKGVVVPHRAIIRLVRGASFISFSASETFLLLAPISFDASTLELWGPLLNGGRLVLMPGDKPSLEDIGRVLRTHGVTTLWLTAGLFALMVDERIGDLAPVRQLLAGGDVLSVPHCERVLRELPGTRLINGYGPTEKHHFQCHARDHAGSRRHDPDWPADVQQHGPCRGRAHASRPPRACPATFSSVGMASPSAICGVPNSTPNASCPTRSAKAACIARATKRAGYPDGTLEFLGRHDGQVKLRGYRIELGGDRGRTATASGVREVAVAVREPVPGDKRLVAYVIPIARPASAAVASDLGTLSAELRAFAATKLPGFMVPSAWMAVDALPLGPTGKVDKAALPALPAATAATPADTTPRSEVERKVQEVWRQVLKVAAVGLHENFFEMGGNSLLLVQAHSKLQTSFAVELPIIRLFQATTVAAVAKLVASRLGGASADHAGAARKVRRSGTPTAGIAIIGWSGPSLAREMSMNSGRTSSQAGDDRAFQRG